MDKLVFIVPHLSTGGAPQFTLSRIEMLKKDYRIICVEYRCYSHDYTVQRDKIKNMPEVEFHDFTTDDEAVKYDKITNLISSNNPKCVFIEEICETFLPDKLCDVLYNPDREYKLLETTHSSILVKDKRYLPDKFLFVSEYSQLMYANLGVPSEVVEYPVDIKARNRADAAEALGLDPNKKHVVNIGLFTQNKNQKYAIDISRYFGDNVVFHFVGNNAPNFKDYWEPLLGDNLPSNCIAWGERSDVDTFLQLADVFLFPSLFELNPLVLKEALEYELPILMTNLDTYGDTYANEPNVTILDLELESDVLKLKNMLKDDVLPDIDAGAKVDQRFNHRHLLPNFLNELGLKGKGVEVGTFKGQFSKIILDTWGGDLYMVDIWRPLPVEEYDDASNNQHHTDAYAETINNISSHVERAHMVRSRSEKAVDLFPDESLDFVYIDANHTYAGVKSDMELWYPKLKKGGLFCGHDYLPDNFYDKVKDQEEKDIPLYLFSDEEPEPKYAGMFGVNPAVDEFALRYGKVVSKTDEFLASWWFLK